MSKKERAIADVMMTTAPPGNINFGALAKNLQRLTDAQLISLRSVIAELCNNEPVPSSTVALVKASACSITTGTSTAGPTNAN